MPSISRWAALCVAACALYGPLPGYASWIQFSLPDLDQPFGGTSLAHLPDGRYVYAQSGNLYLQDAWAAASYTEFSSEPVGIDPSFIAVFDNDTAALGAGGFSASSIYTFDPTDTATPGFTDIGLSLQNFHGVFRDETGLYTGGSDTGPGGNTHGIRFVSLNGLTNTIIIDDVSTFSTGFDVDSAGNLYVGDNDNGELYRFSSLQLDSAITGTPLSITDGTLVYDFGGGGDVGSVAIDGMDRVWAAGFLHDGLFVYDPNTAQLNTVIPNFTNANYRVTTFAVDGTNYVAYANQENPFSGGTDQFYGFGDAATLAIPEPSSFLLIALGLIPFITIRRWFHG